MKKAFHWKLLPMEVVEDLGYLTRKSIAHFTAFQKCWQDADTAMYGRTQNIIELAPGTAMYFMGTRDSLTSRLIRRFDADRVFVKSSCGSGLVLTLEDGIAMSNSERADSFFKGKIKLLNTGSKGLKTDKAEFNEVRRRTLSCVCVYNSNLDGKIAPNTLSRDKTIADSISIQQIGRKLFQLFGNVETGRIMAKVTARKGAVDNLFEQLNME